MIVAPGELLVEFVSHKVRCGLSECSEYSGPYPSGAAAIFADQAARVGASVSVVGSVGVDPFGALLISRLESDGVDVSSVQQTELAATGTAFVSYFASGERIFIFHLDNTAACKTWEGPPIDSDVTLRISGASLGNDEIRAVIMSLAEEAASKGRVSFDPDVRKELLNSRNIRVDFEKILDLAEIFLLSEEDLITLFPDEVTEAVIKKDA